MGEILIAGTASLLICIFLGAEVHLVPARARVRPAHPRGGAGGAPHQGGHADDGRDRRRSSAIAVPFLILTDYDGARSGCSARRSPARLIGFADDYTKIVKRRSLGLRARTKLVVHGR